MKLRRWTFLFPLPNSRSSGTICPVSVAALKTTLAAHFSFDKPMSTKNFARLQTEVAAHIAADPGYIEKTYGIPESVIRLAECIFEGLPAGIAPDFFADFPSAVACDGKDLSRVIWQFLASELRSLPQVDPHIQAVIDSVIEGMDLLARGELWPGAKAAAEDAFAYAFCTEASAAEASTEAAIFGGYSKVKAVCAASAYVVRSCSRAAGGTTNVRLRQRDLLLRLISEAPVNPLI
jgi:hypothetical protein